MGVIFSKKSKYPSNLDDSLVFSKLLKRQLKTEISHRLLLWPLYRFLLPISQRRKHSRSKFFYFSLKYIFAVANPNLGYILENKEFHEQSFEPVNFSFKSSQQFLKKLKKLKFYSKQKFRS